MITDPQGNIVDSFEIGPAILLPDGRAFAIGATGQTALFTLPPAGSDPATNPGTWTEGPAFPADTSAGAVWPTLTVADAPAVLQTNGRVLCIAGNLEERQSSSGRLTYFSYNTAFFEFDPSNDSLTPFAVPPFSPGNGPATWQAHFLLLPTAQILLTLQSGNIWIYTPDAADNNPDPSWRPTIAESFSFATLALGETYTISGTQFNGLSQAVSYGDDAQMATNYPLIRLSNTTGDVAYMRTFNFSTMAVATGTAEVSAQFTVTPTLVPGSWQLEVIANGIPSEPIPVEVVHLLGCQEVIGSLQEFLSTDLHLTAAQELAIGLQIELCCKANELSHAECEEVQALLSQIRASRSPNGGYPRLP